MTSLGTLNNGWPSIAIGEKTQTTIKRRNEDSLSRLEVLDLGRTLGQNRRIDSEIAAGQSVARPEATRRGEGFAEECHEVIRIFGIPRKRPISRTMDGSMVRELATPQRVRMSPRL
ncbi:MAG: hypothetical protein IH899_04050 [Planctomycetes bacterium]|nr:hypothetical protein [Planctomycetota bacterium]